MLAFRARRGSVVCRCTLLAYYAVSCHTAGSSNTEPNAVDIPVPSSCVSELSSVAADDCEDIGGHPDTGCSAEQLAQVRVLLEGFVKSITDYDFKAVCDFSRSVIGLTFRRPLAAWARGCLHASRFCVDRLLRALIQHISRACSTDALPVEHGLAEVDEPYDLTCLQPFCRKLDRDLRRWSGALRRCKRLNSVATAAPAKFPVKTQTSGAVSSAHLHPT
jgi:hypothetical protein